MSVCAGAGNTEAGIVDPMKKTYKPPTLIQYGLIADHTFTTPGGHVKGCGLNCHLDNFGETAGRPADHSGLAIS